MADGWPDVGHPLTSQRASARFFVPFFYLLCRRSHRSHLPRDTKALFPSAGADSCADIEVRPSQGLIGCLYGFISNQAIALMGQSLAAIKNGVFMSIWAQCQGRLWGCPCHQASFHSAAPSAAPNETRPSRKGCVNAVKKGGEREGEVCDARGACTPPFTAI